MLSAALILSLVPTGTFPALSASQLKELRTTKQNVYLPGHVPKGMKANVNVEVSKEDKTQTYYQVTYTLGKSKFTIQSASEGIGDVFLEDDKGNGLESAYQKVKTKPFGEVEIEFDKKTKRQFIVNWIEMPKKQMPRYIAMFGSDISLETAKKIIASVRRA
ncbi:MAG: hypothetical protein ABL949_03030 [Fimbriimonadaceae bacterium]